MLLQACCANVEQNQFLQAFAVFLLLKVFYFYRKFKSFKIAIFSFTFGFSFFCACNKERQVDCSVFCWLNGFLVSDLVPFSYCFWFHGVFFVFEGNCC